MVRKMNESTDMPPEHARPVECAGQPDEPHSRLSAAIMRILASARGAAEGRRPIIPSDLHPARTKNAGDPCGHKDEDPQEGDSSSRVEWTLRMMQ